MNLTLKKGITSLVIGGTLATGGGVVVDKQINPFTDKGTTLEIRTKSSLPEAGDLKRVVSKDEPAITLSKWNGEVALKVKSLDLPPTTTGSRPFLSKNVEWGAGNVKMEAVPIEATTTMEDGGMEINIILNSKPASNVFTFQLSNWENLDFFYQAPLWQEAGLKKPTNDCTDTECDVPNSGKTQRPDDVVGSYAVYYKEHRDHLIGSINYATGKAYHIYRPLVIDNTGNTTWAELTYSNGVLSVDVPEEFLEKATYPIKVDPTFGYTTAGASNTISTNLSQHRGSYVSTRTAVGNETVIDIQTNANCGLVTSSNIDLAVYDIVAGVITNQISTPTTVLVNSTTQQWWVSSALSVPLTAGNVYTVVEGNVAAVSGCATGIRLHRDVGGAGSGGAENGGVPLQNPWVEAATDTNIWSLYADYTVSAPATSQPHKFIFP